MTRSRSGALKSFTAFLGIIVFGGWLAMTSTPAQAEESLSEAQRKEIEALIEDYITKNPDIIMRSLQSMQARKEQAERDHAKEAVVQLRDQLAHDPADPAVGDAAATVTIVEFFDYRCSYCKRVLPDLMKIMAEDKGVRVVFKEFPILGDESVLATRAALAVWNTWPDKYMAYHDAMMGGRGALSANKVYDYAAELGIDTDAMKVAMKDPKVDAVIQRNYELAQILQINGTPAFIIGDELAPGAIDLNAMKQLVAKARKG